MSGRRSQGSSPADRFGDQERLHLDAALLPRLGRFTARMEALRKRREGGRGAREQGQGEEWVGYRPYRAGDDVRGIDWNLLARLDQPFVKLQTRAASERWTLWVDASGSMGVGRPSKLQAAVETALALASLGLARGAEVRFELGGGCSSRLERPAALRRPPDLGELVERLQGLRADGSAELDSWLEVGARGAGRVILVGDLLDTAPTRLARAVRPGVDWVWLQLLAQRELELGAGLESSAPVEFLDPEPGRGHDRQRAALDGGTRATYQRRLSERLEEFGRVARRHRLRYGCFEAGRPFEDTLAEMFRG